MSKIECPFCAPGETRIVFKGDLCYGIWDRYSVSSGHALIIPRRHVTDWFDATPEEQAELMTATKIVRSEIENRHAPDGYNIGVNSGPAAGQTVHHLHVHMIPRYEGDVADPRGGIRWVLPDKAAYWTDE